MDQEFQPVCAVTVDGVEIFSLNDFNDYRGKGSRIGRAVAPVLTLAGLYLAWVSFRRPEPRRVEERHG